MEVIGIAGWSGSGKTTLVVALLPCLIAQGFRVSTLKHAHHGFDLDKPGKDSHRHREAGATEVLVSSAKRWAMFHELRNESELDLDQLMARMAPVDLLIVEGFKEYPYPKIEVHRPSVGKPLLQADDPNIIAVASDAPLGGLTVPVLDLADADGIADFIITHCRLKAA